MECGVWMWVFVYVYPNVYKYAFIWCQRQWWEICTKIRTLSRTAYECGTWVRRFTSGFCTLELSTFGAGSFFSFSAVYWRFKLTFCQFWKCIMDFTVWKPKKMIVQMPRSRKQLEKKSKCTLKSNICLLYTQDKEKSLKTHGEEKNGKVWMYTWGDSFKSLQLYGWRTKTFRNYLVNGWVWAWVWVFVAHNVEHKNTVLNWSQYSYEVSALIRWMACISMRIVRYAICAPRHHSKCVK